MLLNYHGREFIFHPELSRLQRAYVWLFGIPISGMRIRLRRILPHVRGEFRSIIDLGCGKGVFTFELARRFPGAEVVGIDIDERQIAINNEIARRVGLKNVRFEVADMLALPSAFDGRFDLALSVDNLEHIENDLEALRGVRRVLRPGGRLVCHVPARRRIWLFRKQSTNFDVPGHVRPGYEAEEIRKKLVEAGFSIERSGHTYGYLETISNNLSYLITGAAQKNVLVYALAFPFLNLIAWLGRNQDPKDKGAGVLSLAIAPERA